VKKEDDDVLWNVDDDTEKPAGEEAIPLPPPPANGTSENGAVTKSEAPSRPQEAEKKGRTQTLSKHQKKKQQKEARKKVRFKPHFIIINSIEGHASSKPKATSEFHANCYFGLPGQRGRKCWLNRRNFEFFLR
jgi:hypothetical protein